MLFRIVQAFVSICFAITMFLLFPWDTALAILALMVLITLWVIFFRQRISRSKEFPKRSPEEVAKIISSIKSSNLNASETENEIKGIDSEVFKAFQKNLDKKTGKVGLTKNKDSTVNDLKQEEDGIVLNLSGKRTQPVEPPAIKKETQEKETKPEKQPLTYSKSALQKKAAKKAETASEEASVPPKEKGKEESTGLFDDIYEQLESEQLKNEEEKTKAIQKKEEETAPQPTIANEVIDSDDFDIKEDDLQKEAQVILKMAEASMANSQYKETVKMVDKWLQYHTESIGTLDQFAHQLIFLKGKACFLMDDFIAASSVWEGLFKNHMKKTDILYLQMLNEVIDTFQENNQLQHSISFLFTLLNEYRVKGDRLKMDEVYLQIEAGYEQQEDWPRLIQTYQNHLSIRKAQNDYEGQLELLDALGKLYYDQDDKAGSRSCYEQSIQIKKEMLEKE